MVLFGKSGQFLPGSGSASVADFWAGSWPKMGHFWPFLGRSFLSFSKMTKNDHFWTWSAQIPASSGINWGFYRFFLKETLHVVGPNLGLGKNAQKRGIFADTCRELRFLRKMWLRNVVF